MRTWEGLRAAGRSAGAGRCSAPTWRSHPRGCGWVILYRAVGLEQPQVLLLGVAVRHAGEVVADGPLDQAVARPPGVALRKELGGARELVEELPQHPPSLGR